MIVKSILNELAIPFLTVELGRVELETDLEPALRVNFDAALSVYELELMENRKKILVERVKVAIVQMLHSDNGEVLVKLSEHLSKNLRLDYTYLANTFSEIEGSTIEKFYILNKVKRIKELMIYEGMSIKEISFELNYSSVSHLSLQFKKVTGKTPSMFKKLWETEKATF